jgi:carboxylesterase type B
VESFGGDPRRVTLFGQGVGSASVCYLSVNPSAVGLFQRGIMQSGECLVGDGRPDSIGLISGEEGYEITLDVLDGLNATFEELADRDLFPASKIAKALTVIYPVLDWRILPDYPS